MIDAEHPNGTAVPSGHPDAWFTTGRFAAILAILIAAAFPDVLAGARTFVFRDFGLFSYPLAAYYRACFWEGELPGWNPLNNCGIPFLAQWCPMVFYPFSLIYLILPLSWSLGFFCLCHLMVAGLGMHSLAKRWVGSAWAASVAGIAFAFNGLMLNSLSWPHYMAAFCWMPWVVQWTELAWRNGRGRILAAAGVGALQMLTGAPEIVFFTWIFLLALFGVEMGRREFPWRPGLARLAGVVLGVAGLAAIQLIPFLELLQHSQRSSHFAAEQWAMPVSGWANFLVPLFRCHPSAYGLYFQHTQHWTVSYYLGIGILALAILAIWQRPSWQVRFLAAVTGASLLLALGKDGYVYAALQAIVPAVGFMRFPVKFVVWAIFSLPLLAAFGLGRRAWSEPGPRSQTLRRGAVVVLIVLGLIGIILGIAHYRPHPLDHWSATWKNGLERAGSLVLLAAGLWAATRAGSGRAQVMWRGACLVLIWFDAITHMPGWKWVAPRWIYTPGMATAEQKWTPRISFGQSRAMVSAEAAWKLDHFTLAKPEEDYLASRLGLFSDCNLLENIPKVDGFFPLYLREEHQLHDWLYQTDHAIPTGLLDFLGIAQVTAPGKLTEWAARTNYLPLITCGQQPVFVDAEKMLGTLIGPAFDPRQTVLLPLEAKPQITANRSPQARILSPVATRQRMEMEVVSAESTLVVIAQCYYPAWRAWVDEKPATLWRANHQFQALQVPAGRHRVRLAYQDRGFFWGALVSGLTLGIGLCLGRGRRNPNTIAARNFWRR
jgi:hypothetical protein